MNFGWLARGAARAAAATVTFTRSKGRGTRGPPRDEDLRKSRVIVIDSKDRAANGSSKVSQPQNPRGPQQGTKSAESTKMKSQDARRPANGIMQAP